MNHALKSDTSPLRVALVAGCLERHGAEKQAVFMARVLRQSGVEVRIYTLTRGDHYEQVLRSEGFEVEWIGALRNPLLRVLVLIKKLHSFRPHIIQATLGHNNLHVALAGAALNCISLGALRTDLEKCGKLMGFWTPYLFRYPTGIIVNSKRAELQLRESGLTDPDRVWLLPNAIDWNELAGNDENGTTALREGTVTAIFLSRLVALKRLDLFLRALAEARVAEPSLRGLVVGDGPEREPMMRLAEELGLLPDCVLFVGESHNPGEHLRRSDFLVLCSEHEGSPNSVLEAMALGRPAIVTPAGDAPLVVQHGRGGFVVEFDDVAALSGRMVELARFPELRAQMGRAARDRIEDMYNLDGLAARLFAIYMQAASKRRSHLPLPASSVAADRRSS